MIEANGLETCVSAYNGPGLEHAASAHFIAATNKDLLAAMEKHEFRDDLYHRLSVILIHVPSLNERLDDIPLLVDHFIAEFCLPDEICGIDDEASSLLMNYNYPGNIRELENVVLQGIIYSKNDTIQTADMFDGITIPIFRSRRRTKNIDPY